MASSSLSSPTPAWEEIEADLREYYTGYYRDALGLPDWSTRVEGRLRETEGAKVRFELLERWFNRPLRKEDRVLVVGCGTGAELFAFLQAGCDAVGIDPDREATRIARKKCLQQGFGTGRVQVAAGERLPFGSNAFDIVWCYTVLEHVRDPASCVREMVRVCRPGGHIYMEMPDYRHVYEAHYKMLLPMFLPRWVVAAILRLRGRPVRFLRTLQLVNARKITNVLQNEPVIAFQAVYSWPKGWQEAPTPLSRLTRWIARRYGIQRDQHWIVRKLPQPL